MRTRSPAPESSVGAAAVYVLMYPWKVFVIDWNWKTAVLSAIFRLAVWPATMAGRGRLFAPGAIRGLLIEFALRIAVGGFWGSLSQAFSAARPAWLAGLCLVVFLPGTAHCLEYLALRAGGASHAPAVITVSVAFSVLSLLMNWGLMRKGILVTGQGAGSLAADMRRIFLGVTGISPATEAAGENSGEPVA